MKILQINTVYGRGSTGKIAQCIHDKCVESGIECVTAYRYFEKGDCFSDTIEVDSWISCHAHNRISRITGTNGLLSFFHTLIFLRKITRYSPDIIHIHNIHANYINIPLLFRYVSKHKIPVVWTLHDCWSFTGGCFHFEILQCYLWKTNCQNCVFLKSEPHNLFDGSSFMFNRKKKWFNNVDDMILVTPSFWLDSIVKQSFLQRAKAITIHNGIDLSIFHPMTSTIKNKYGLEEKYIVLGIADQWSNKKGIDVFIELSRKLDSRYSIVLVGTDDSIDAILPNSIVSIHRTFNQSELVEWYSCADVFLNPTREEVLGLVNIESLACGTPVITFDSGGSPECIDDTCGMIGSRNCNELLLQIEDVCENKRFSEENCINRARQFNLDLMCKEYIDLYHKVINKDNII